MPDELKRALAEDRSLRRWFDRLNHSTRNEISKWVSDVKSAEDRTRRAEQIAERLLATMEAERELPPILQVAFAQDPKPAWAWSPDCASDGQTALHAIRHSLGCQQLGIFPWPRDELVRSHLRWERRCW